MSTIMAQFKHNDTTVKKMNTCKWKKGKSLALFFKLNVESVEIIISIEVNFISRNLIVITMCKTNSVDEGELRRRLYRLKIG